jgi:hypothetical protein
VYFKVENASPHLYFIIINWCRNIFVFHQNSSVTCEILRQETKTNTKLRPKLIPKHEWDNEWPISALEPSRSCPNAPWTQKLDVILFQRYCCHISSLHVIIKNLLLIHTNYTESPSVVAFECCFVKQRAVQHLLLKVTFIDETFTWQYFSCHESPL